MRFVRSRRQLQKGQHRQPQWQVSRSSSVTLELQSTFLSGFLEEGKCISQNTPCFYMADLQYNGCKEFQKYYEAQQNFEEACRARYCHRLSYHWSSLISSPVTSPHLITCHHTYIFHLIPVSHSINSTTAIVLKEAAESCGNVWRIQEITLASELQR